MWPSRLKCFPATRFLCKQKINSWMFGRSQVWDALIHDEALKKVFVIQMYINVMRGTFAFTLIISMGRDSLLNYNFECVINIPSSLWNYAIFMMKVWRKWRNNESISELTPLYRWQTIFERNVFCLLVKTCKFMDKSIENKNPSMHFIAFFFKSRKNIQYL